MAFGKTNFLYKQTGVHFYVSELEWISPTPTRPQTNHSLQDLAVLDMEGLKGF